MSSQAPRRNVFLIGPMGSGKTAVGKQLARLLHLDLLRQRRRDRAAHRRRHPVHLREGRRDRLPGARARSDRLSDAAPGRGHRHRRRRRAAAGESRAARRARPRRLSARPASDQQLERTRHGRQRPLLYTADPEAKLRELMEVSRAAVRIHRQRHRRDRRPARARRRGRDSQRLQESRRRHERSRCTSASTSRWASAAIRS